MFSLNGVYSGLDVNSMVDALVNAERVPVESRLARKEGAANVELSAIGQLKSALKTFQTQLQGMDTEAELSPFSHTVTDESVLSATVSSTASAGTYTFYVDQLASNHQLISDSISTSDTIGTGDATFTVNGQSFTVTLASGTLTELRDAINSASDNTGVNAVIVNDGGNERLMLTSQNTGAAYAVTTDFSGLTGGSATLNDPLTELEAAADANIRFGSGGSAVTITSEDNTLENVIDGVTLTLKAKSTNPQTLEINRDTAALKTLIEGFVDAWNTLEGTFDSLTSYDGTTAGALNGDSQTRLLKNQLRQEFGNLLGVDGDSFRTLSGMGITSTSDGALSINSIKLDDAINNNYDKVVAAFIQPAPDEAAVQSLTLTGMSDSNYNQTFVDAGVDGWVLDAVDPDPDWFATNPSYELYKHDAGGGTWYVAYRYTDGFVWNVATSTTDPSTWSWGDDLSLSNIELFTSDNETYEGISRPDSADDNVSYPALGAEEGLIHRLTNILSPYLSSGDGSLSSRETGINETLTQVADGRADLEVRLAKVRTYYQNQFTQMESLLASLSGTSQWLTNNLQNLNQSTTT